MGSYELDDVDRRILHLLQQDSRGTSTETIGDQVGVAASTVGRKNTTE
ncbi:AsnC family protein [Halorussus sp. AFM4]